MNKELMQIFLQCHIVEQSGHGAPKIVKRCGPECCELGTSMITVTIPFDKNGFSSNVTEDVGVNVGLNVGVKLTRSVQKLFS